MSEVETKRAAIDIPADFNTLAWELKTYTKRVEGLDVGVNEILREFLLSCRPAMEARLMELKAKFAGIELPA